MIEQLCKYLGVPVRAAEDAMGSERLALMGRRALLGGGLGLLACVAYAVPTGRELGTLVLFDRSGGVQERLEIPVDLGSPVVSTREPWSGFRGADLLDSRGQSVLVNRTVIQSIVVRKTGGSEFRLKTEDGLPWSDRSASRS